MTDALDRTNPSDAAVVGKLTDLVGDYFASAIANDAAWAREVVGMGPSDS